MRLNFGIFLLTWASAPLQNDVGQDNPEIPEHSIWNRPWGTYTTRRSTVVADCVSLHVTRREKVVFPIDKKGLRTVIVFSCMYVCMKNHVSLSSQSPSGICGQRVSGRRDLWGCFDLKIA